MKGCLSFIIKTIIAVLVFFGLQHIGAIDFIKEKIKEYQGDTSKQEKMIEQAKDVIDLSQINDEYFVDKNLNFMGNRIIVAEHNATRQKMIMLEPKSESFLTKEDIESEKVEEKINNLINKYSNAFFKLENLKVKKAGKMYALNQTIPYVRATIKITNYPIKNMDGILGVAELENGKNILIMAISETGTYSQIITDAFYEKVQ